MALVLILVKEKNIFTFCNVCSNILNSLLDIPMGRYVIFSFSYSTVFRIESSIRVLAKPDFETKAFSNIMCARECQKQLNPCDVLSYHRPTKVCVGFSSMDALSERKRHQRGWDTLVASRM